MSKRGIYFPPLFWYPVSKNSVIVQFDVVRKCRRDCVYANMKLSIVICEIDIPKRSTKLVIQSIKLFKG